MGASQKRALDSYMQRLIEHILKLKYWRLRSSTRRVSTPRRRQAQGNARACQSEVDRCRNGWMVEITNFRSRINRILKKNPSLKNYLGSEYNDIYQDATKAMKLLFKMPEDNFVELHLIMQDDYFG